VLRRGHRRTSEATRSLKAGGPGRTMLAVLGPHRESLGSPQARLVARGHAREKSSGDRGRLDGVDELVKRRPR